MRTIRASLLVLLASLALVGCSGDGGDRAGARVDVLVLEGAVPFAAAQVVFHHLDGSVYVTVPTDASGEAVGRLLRPGYVSVLWQDSVTGAYRAEMRRVDPGGAPVIGIDGSTALTASIQFPGDVGAANYRVCASCVCLDTASVATPVTLDVPAGCMDAAGSTVAALALDATGLVTDYTVLPAVAASPVTLPAWSNMGASTTSFTYTTAGDNPSATYELGLAYELGDVRIEHQVSGITVAGGTIGTPDVFPDGFEARLVRLGPDAGRSISGGPHLPAVAATSFDAAALFLEQIPVPVADAATGLVAGVGPIPDDATYGEIFWGGWHIEFPPTADSPLHLPDLTGLEDWAPAGTDMASLSAVYDGRFTDFEEWNARDPRMPSTEDNYLVRRADSRLGTTP